MITRTSRAKTISKREGFPGDEARGRRLFGQLAGERFWCESCGGCHPLREHRDCRAANPHRSVFRRTQ